MRNRLPCGVTAGTSVKEDIVKPSGTRTRTSALQSAGTAGISGDEVLEFTKADGKWTSVIKKKQASSSRNPFRFEIDPATAIRKTRPGYTTVSPGVYVPIMREPPKSKGWIQSISSRKRDLEEDPGPYHTGAN